MSVKQAEVFVYLPGDTRFARAARACMDAGATLIAHAGDHGWQGQLTRHVPGQPLPASSRVVLGAEHHLVPGSIARALGALAGRHTLVEVCDVASAQEAVRAGASGLIACGFEGPGLVGEETGLVLLRRLLPLGLPVHVRGGIGPDSAAAVVAAGAAGVILEHQLWACEEWPVEAALRQRLAAFNPTDTKSLGTLFGLRYRVFGQVATRPPRQLLADEPRWLKQASARSDYWAELVRQTSKTPWMADLKSELLPLGQCAALAAPLAARHHSTAGIIHAVKQAISHALTALPEAFPLREGAGVASVNHTRLPLHQGPMAQVSDTPAFARAVVDAGSMPWLALGNMPAAIAEDVVWRTGQALEGRAFGAGIIGLEANRHRDAHIEMIARAAKTFPHMMALVAAGSAEQAMQLEAMGVKTYLHTPTAGVFDAALKAGQRRFLLEGAEAGGHIGQLGGLLLWQLCALSLQGFIERGEVKPSEVALLPAGGLSDAASAAAVSALFLPLVEQGVSFGIQLGTAYLMTREAVETGAITPMYQQVGAASQGTVVMGEGVGAPTRVLSNRAADRVAAAELERVATGVSLKERKEAYEHDNLGGLRAAAKAQRIARVDPEHGAIFEDLSWDQQEQDGLFHAGQSIALLEQTRTIADLHHEVTRGALAHILALTGRTAQPAQQRPQSHDAAGHLPQAAPAARQPDAAHEPIAIVGVGVCLPGALSREAFWSNLKDGVSAIGEVPADRWDAALYFSEDRSEPDKTYSKIGGWVTGFEFDRKAFRLPPAVVTQMDGSQTLWLAAAREALQDADMLEGDFDRERCAVILGNAMGGDMRDFTNLRIQYPEVEAAMREVIGESGRYSATEQAQLLERIKANFMAGRLPVTEDTMPGELANVIAGRTAQLFDLGGANYTVDAACASSLAAMDAAVRGLRARRFDSVITGGVDRVMGAPAFVKFSKIGALSPDGTRPFDANANGFVMGEGAAALVLKRLSDAQRDGDEIYGVVLGIGASSDGRGKAITAPNPIGQERAIERAYQEAGFGPRAVSLFEAHGTSTPVGDPVEVGALCRMLERDDSPRSAERASLGSVKSMIGHLKSAAGAASVVKVALALRHKMLPPTLNVQTLNPALELEASALRIQHEVQDWHTNQGHLRRAGVSAFGFGGTNFHVVMQEWRGDQDTVFIQHDAHKDHATPAHTSSATVAAAPAWNEGILALSAPTPQQLAGQVQDLIARLERDGHAAALPHMLPVSAPALPTHQAHEHRLAIIFEAPEELPGRLERAQKALEKGKGWRVLSNQGVIYSGELEARGSLAMLFPGQGSQYLGMLATLAERYDVVRQTFAEADAVMAPVLGQKISDLIHPDLAQVDKMEAFIRLSQTEITQPAVLTVDVALWRLLAAFGIKPDVVAGHSLGEYGACVAAGVMTFEEALRTVATRGTEMASAAPMNGDCGLMASIPAGAEQVEEELERLNPGYVVCANKNSPNQTIIAGLTEPMQRVVAHFEAQGMQVMMLPVSHAFHSEVVAAASKPLRRHLDTVDIQLPETPILTNVTGEHYPADVDAIRDQLALQVAAPVEFIAMIERMWQGGARVFVEVGPKRAQASFVSAILEDRPHVSLYCNHPKKGDVRSWLDTLAALWITGSWGVQQATSAPAPLKTAQQAPEAQVIPPDAALNGASHPAAPARADVAAKLLQVLCEKTGYDADEIEVDYELEADLGIDTVKQAEIIAAVRDSYGMTRDEDFRLADYPTLSALTDYVVQNLGAGAPGGGAQLAPQDLPQHEQPHAPAAPPLPASAPAPAPHAAHARSDVAAKLMEVLCEKTGYDADEIEPDYELEADLGIDTVKQAEIIAAVRDSYGMTRDEDFRLADYPTLNALTDYVVQNLGAGAPGGGAQLAPQDLPQHEQPHAPAAPPLPASAPAPARSEVAARLLQVLCEKTGYDADEIEPDYELEADLGIDTVKQAEIIAAVRDSYGMGRDEDFRLADYPTLNALTDYVVARTSDSSHAAPARAESAHAPALTMDAPAHTAARALSERSSGVFRHDIPADVSISGAAVGLPGLDELFDEHAMEHLFAGRNMIGLLPQQTLEAQASNRINRLFKRSDGSAEMVEVTDPSETIKLAGQAGSFDLTESWGVPERMVGAMDPMSQMAFAAGLEALRDAKLPLIPRYRETTTGKKITIGWRLPEAIGKRTGVIFASVFSGMDSLAKEITARHTDPDYRFDHRFLTKIIAMGHARFAEYIGATGPNMHVNAACATSTAAMGMASDWIRLGRCDRVVVIAAENPTGPELRDWIASGFLAAGAATTSGVVEEAALPFDRRRHGMIVGMSAVGAVVERDGLPEERGLEPIADLLDTRFVNSAFHPTRLDVDHIAEEVDDMLTGIEQRFALDRAQIAARTVFVSHETYTPARGGSASAEIGTLRRAFGEHASQVVIANVKGFTGHPMGSSTEDILAMRVLQRQQVPPIANLKEPDPELGDLRISQGGDYEVDYAMRFAAGFGSQLAISLYRWRARQQERVYDKQLQTRWLRQHTGFEEPVLEVVQRTLRVREARPEDHATSSPQLQNQPQESPAPAAPVIPAPAPKEPAQPDAMPAGAVLAEDIARFAPRHVVTQALPATPVDVAALRARLAGERVAIVAGPMMPAEWLQNVLLELGTSAFIIADSSRRSPLDAQHATFVDLQDEPALMRALKGARGVLNLTGFGREADTPQDVYTTARQSYHVARAFLGALGQRPGADHFFITITGMGGQLGLSGAAMPGAGVAAGVTKSLAREWELATVRVVDIRRDIIGQPDAAHALLTEAFAAQNPIEVGCAEGVRYLPAFLEAAEMKPGATSHELGAHTVMLVTGGAKGITAEIAVDLSQRFGCKLALVGRTAMTSEDALAEDLDAHRARIKQELAARGQRATPMAIKRALSGLLSQQTIARNMARMRAAGAQVAYFSCDMADPVAIEGMLAQVRERFGRVHGVLHGAGVEISRLVQEKDVAEFDRVFLAKALGGMVLWERLREQPLDFFVAFSSIAGRFGNFGQTDYAAANEALNKLVTKINATTSTRAISIDWTAWAEVGMASRGSMPDILSSRGIDFLPVPIGAPIVGELLEAQARGEVLVAGGLGELGADVRGVSAHHLPLVDEILARDENSLVIARTLDVRQDRFMRDHVYEGNPLMPGVMGLEMMCEAAKILGDGQVHTISAVKFERALKLHHGQPQQVQAHARITRRDSSARHIEVRVITQRESKTGRLIEQVHFSAQVAVAETCAPRDEERMVLSPHASSWRSGPARAAIYERFFHEGTFQILDEVTFLSERAIIGYARLGSEPLSAGRDDADLISDPLAREAAFQVAGLWGMIHKQMSCLPHGIERAESFGHARPGERLVIRARRAPADREEHVLEFDCVEVLSEGGELLHRMHGVSLIAHQPLREEERFERTPPARWTWRECDEACGEELLAGAPQESVLAQSERAEHDRLISARRRQEWLAARLAIKDLARCWARDFFGQRTQLAEFWVLKDEHGAPSLASERVFPVALPPVTMSHSRGVARAAIGAPGKPGIIGVDLELIEPRDASFAEQYFTPEERALTLSGGAQDTLLTALWCCKEAVSKALGLGLKLRASDMVVEGFGEDGGRGVAVKMTLRREAREVLERLGAARIDVRLFLMGDFALALAQGAEEGESAARPLDASELTQLATLLHGKGHAESAQ